MDKISDDDYCRTGINSLNDWVVANCQNFDYTAREDVIFFICEALKRLSAKCRDKAKMIILMRYLINQEKSKVIAQDFHVKIGYINVVQTRYKPKLQELILQVMAEDEDGTLVLSSEDISYLEPYMKSW